jgi:hypothetical protein
MMKGSLSAPSSIVLGVRMFTGDTRSISEAAQREGAHIARETLDSIRGEIQGVQICPPQGRIDLVFDVLGL